MKLPLWAACAGLPVLAATAADFDVHVGYENDIYTSAVIITSTLKGAPEADDPTFIGDLYGMVQVQMEATANNQPFAITVTSGSFCKPTTYTGKLPKAGRSYAINPVLKYDYDKLLAVRQPCPEDVTVSVTRGGKPLGEVTSRAILRPVTDVILGIGHDEENYEDTTFMFAAYVNENHPIVDDILASTLRHSAESAEMEEEDGCCDSGEGCAGCEGCDPSDGCAEAEDCASETCDDEGCGIDEEEAEENSRRVSGVVNSFAGYQQGRDEVLQELTAIWNELQRRGFRYSDISQSSTADQDGVASQHVRLIGDSTRTNQANCVEGSCLLASIFRKLGLDTVLVTVPGHMFVGVFLDPDHEEFLPIETTMVGDSTLEEAVESGLEQFNKHEDALMQSLEEESAVDDCMLVDIATWRKKGVLPLRESAAR